MVIRGSTVVTLTTVFWILQIIALFDHKFDTPHSFFFTPVFLMCFSNARFSLIRTPRNLLTLSREMSAFKK